MLFEPMQTVPLRRTALVAVVAVSAAVGLAPYALFVGRLRIPILVGTLAIAAAVAVWRLRGESSLATEQPTVGELMLGGWSTVTYSAAMSLFGIATYYVARLALWLGSLAAGWLDMTLRVAVEPWAVGASLVLMTFSAAGTFGTATRELVKALYPTTAGARSPFFALLVERWRLLAMAVVAAAFTALCAAFLWRQPRVLAGCVLLLLLYTGASLENLGLSGADSRSKHRGLSGLARVFELAGYETTRSPRTGMSSVDPLITTVDLLARSPRRAWVVEVKTTGTQPVEWHEASRLRNAALVLQEVLVAEAPAIEVEPLLVLAGRPRGASLDRYLAGEAMGVVELDAAELEELGADPDARRLRELAGRLGIDRPAAERLATSGREGA